jgi:hypothetical protein
MFPGTGPSAVPRWLFKTVGAGLSHHRSREKVALCSIIHSFHTPQHRRNETFFQRSGAQNQDENQARSIHLATNARELTRMEKTKRLLNLSICVNQQNQRLSLLNSCLFAQIRGKKT